MSDYESDMLIEIKKISSLLELLAEDKIAQRDGKQRVALLEIVGTSAKKRASVLLMDGTKTQTDIHKITSLHKGDLSELVGELWDAKLLMGDKKMPHLAIPIRQDFFESNAKAK
jgi:hypothetical protein